MNNEQLTKALGTIKNYVDTTKMNYLKYGSIDVDTLKTTGIYSLASNCTNNATTNAGTMVVDFNVGTPYQLWIPDNTHAFHKRNWNKTNSTWGEWTATIASGISGNAATATKLATARNIILTGDVTGSVSFNGTSDVSITATVADNSHSHSNYLPLAGGFMLGDIEMQDSIISFTGPTVGSSADITHGDSGINIDSSGSFADPGIFFNLYKNSSSTSGGGSNKASIGSASASITYGGNGVSIITAGKFSGALIGNAATATKLATAKTINGTSFDGSENITTANWGTARTLTIGNTGKSVNGSGNVTWSLSEIGALPLTGGTLTGRVKFNSEVFIENGQYIKTNIFEDDSYVPILGTAKDNCVVGDQEFNLQLRSYVNPSIKLPEGSYKIYHEGNKPTAADIGAAAAHSHPYVSNTYLTNAGNAVFTWAANTCANTITMGYNNLVSQPSSVLLGCNNTGKGEYSYIIGHDCLLNSGWGVTVGKNNKIYGSNSFTGGISNTIGTSSSEIPYAHAVGYQNTITKGYGVAVGNKNTVSGVNSIALGYENSVTGQKSSSLGYCTSAKGTFSTAIGGYTTALGENSTAIGYRTTAGGVGSFAEGYSTNSATSLVLDYSPSTTYDTIKSKWSSRKFSLAHGKYSHCEGLNNIAYGQASHAEGWYTMAKADCGHAGGYFTVANSGQYAIGHFNTEDSGSTTGTSNTALIIGNGADGALSNACRITYAGAVIGKAAYKSSGADYAEYFEWLDGNPNAEDRRGYFVTMKGKNIQIAKKGDYILGIVSAYPAVIGNNDMEWQGQFLLDEFGAPVKKKYTGINEITGEEEEYEYFVVNPDYDPDKEYIHREDRPEWDAIGMMGVLSVYDDGTCEVDGFSECNDEGIATASESGYRVIERVNDHIVKVLFR